jgi:Zinc finger, C3HC4 type (RING finger)
MGIDSCEFVHPERISSQLVCPICTLILENPVITEYEHLYCENCLLDWLAVKEVCPLTSKPLRVNSIKEPGRIISNMLGELERYCCNRQLGCTWTGEQCNYAKHANSCTFRSREKLLEEIEEYKDIVEDYAVQVEEYHNEVNHYKVDMQFMEQSLNRYRRKVEDLEGVVIALNAKLKVYDKLHRIERDHSDGDEGESDLSGIVRFRRFEKAPEFK